jgi:CRISPR-associated endonuclease/helicase Cas3
VARYFDYYFFQRKDEMRYPVTSQAAGRDDTLLNLMGENQLAVHAYTVRYDRAPPLVFRQAFMTAARSFRAIDAPSQGIVVPYGDEGRSVVTRLCASFDPTRQFEAMRLAQQYSVNVFPQAFDALGRAGAVAEISEGTGIFHLRPEHYSEEFGLSEEPVSAQEVLNA